MLARKQNPEMISLRDPRLLRTIRENEEMRREIDELSNALAMVHYEAACMERHIMHLEGVTPTIN
jgi:hypothetical protein